MIKAYIILQKELKKKIGFIKTKLTEMPLKNYFIVKIQQFQLATQVVKMILKIDDVILQGSEL